MLGDLNNTDTSRLGGMTITVRPSLQVDSFARYPLPEPVLVRDTVYIGWRQQTSDFIGVGLDKSSDNTLAPVWSATRGDWVENTLVTGNLMLRPVFDTVASVSITALPGVVEDWARVYPNPARNECYILGNLRAVHLVDAYGRVSRVNLEPVGTNEYRISLQGYAAGVYYLRMVNDEGEQQIEKLIRID